jgi:adenine-specific DNA-methyltransferase
MDFPKISKEIFNPINENLQRLASLFPDTVKDGQLDVAALQAALGQVESVSDSQSERYELGWAGKAQAKRIANMDVIGRTLRYVPEDSKNADTTENLYIEGDNLEVLKLLRNSYYNKIKMIYIDPPYNTGNDFVYKDKFATSEKAAAQAEGDVDEEGNRLVINQKSSGRYHSNWLGMMYPRLKVAKDLLREDGVIFISIDDNEIDNLNQLCRSVFDESNFVSILVWEKKKKGSFLSNSITNVKEYIVVYCKDKTAFEGLIGEINEDAETYPCINADNNREIRRIPAGIISKYRERNFTLPAGTVISDTTMSIVLHSDLVIKNGVLATELVIEGNWRYSQDSMQDYAHNKELYITRDLYLRRIVTDARYKTMKDLLPRTGDESDKNHKAVINVNNLFESGWGSNEDADEELRLLFGIQKIMDYPKPVRLIEKLTASIRDKDCMVLDFFSGSATTAHAVMQLNAEDGGNRKFILVQIPEVCDEKSEAYKAGYKNICDIGKERIRRAGEKIKQDLMEKQKGQASLLDSPPIDPDKLDIGFKVFKTADTNIRWFSEAMLSNQMHLSEDMMSDKDRLDFNPGYTDLDVVYEILLRHRDIPLSTVVEPLPHIGNRMYLAASTIAVCLEETITDAMIDAITAIEPLPTKIIFRDSAFGIDITLKENTMLRLEAQMKRASGSEKRAYRVEFI